MCGIVGIADLFRDIADEDIEKMRDLLQYRGPDGFGLVNLKSDKVALGHRRLSILDLSPSGNQPMSNNSNTMFIVFNGEIYNYLELRQELEQHGYVFRTGTDTEVLLSAYEYWGKECLDLFVGMFAFAIWDKRKQELFMARDRLGIKPLYYTRDSGRFFLASEVKAIYSMIKDRPPVDISLIDGYMSFGYVPGDNTLHKGIKKLLPGHYMIYNKSGISIKRYWDIDFTVNDNNPQEYYVERLKKLLNDSIDLRLRSDVPLGIFLSGGIDSSSVVALLAPRVPKRLKTFSVAYDFGPKYNETSYARLVAQKFNTDHHELFITSRDFRDFIPGFIHHMGEPVTESAAISLYYLSIETKKHVTVVLSGEGSDELFAGYDFYVYNRVIERCRNLLGDNFFYGLCKAGCKMLPHRKANKYLTMGQKRLEERYRGISTYNESIKEDLYRNELWDELNRCTNSLRPFLDDLFKKTKRCDPLSRMLYFDTKTWLVDDLLIKADRMSMAASLELRVPFLDHRLVEFTATIPSKYKIRRNDTKYILKKAMKNILPDAIINRKKMGFPTPLETMFKNELFDYAADMLLSNGTRIRDYFDQKYISCVLDEHHTGRALHHNLIWQLVVLEEWHKQFA